MDGLIQERITAAGSACLAARVCCECKLLLRWSVISVRPTKNEQMQSRTKRRLETVAALLIILIAPSLVLYHATGPTKLSRRYQSITFDMRKDQIIDILGPCDLTSSENAYYNQIATWKERSDTVTIKFTGEKVYMMSHTFSSWRMWDWLMGLVDIWNDWVNDPEPTGR